MTCWVCCQTITDDCWVNVVFGDVVRRVCTDCMARGDEPDYQEPPDLNREGDPTLNGAFG